MKNNVRPRTATMPIVRSYFISPYNNLILEGSSAPGFKHYTLKLKELEEKDRPREKMLQKGPEVLSVPELMSVLLNVGTKRESVTEMSARILKEYGEKNIINQTDPRVIAAELDIPLIKACQIVACFELGKRFFRRVPGGPVYIRNARDAFSYLSDMRFLPKEQLRGLYLNSQYRLIHDEVISVGSLTANITHPREVFKPAVEYSAAAVIVAHNHPSGEAEPTKADLAATEQLIKAGQIFGIELLDHIIIAGNKFASIPADY